MKKVIIIVCLLPTLCFGQDDPNQKKPEKKKSVKRSLGFGIKGGLNFANVRGASSVNTSHQTGFMGGAFMAPPSTGFMGYRSEIIYSKQGYNYATQSNAGQIDLDYIILPNLMTFNITKFVQLQVGGQMAFLLNAKSDSTKGTTSGSYGGAMDLYNKFDYGFAGGVEIHPIKGLLIGARVNVSMGNVYKDPSKYQSGTPPPGLPAGMPQIPKDIKNNVLQVFAGWIF